MQKITPFLWFNGQAEEATQLYTGTFKNAQITEVMRSGGNVVSTTFEIEGQRFIALNGGPQFTFTPAISLFVNCEAQAEVDHLWETLSEGGKKLQCGWLTDRFGISWQIVPVQLGQLLRDPDPAKSKRVMNAMMKMTKLDIAGLQAAYNEN